MTNGATSDDALAFDAVLERVVELAEQLTAPGAKPTPEAVGELLDWVDAFHRESLGRLVEMVRAWRGEIFLDAASADPVAGRLLATYGLGPAVDAGPLVESALDEVRPVVESHRGVLELIDVVDGVVTVRLAGTCDGCPSSDATLTYGVEEALRRRWSGFRRLEVEVPEGGAAPPSPSNVDLRCGFPDSPSAVPRPDPPLLQIRGHEQR